MLRSPNNIERTNGTSFGQVLVVNTGKSDIVKPFSTKSTVIDVHRDHDDPHNDLEIEEDEYSQYGSSDEDDDEDDESFSESTLYHDMLSHGKPVVQEKQKKLQDSTSTATSRKNDDNDDEDHNKRSGLFLSLNMVQMLRQSTSDGNLASQLMIQDETIFQKMTPLPSRSSTSCLGGLIDTAGSVSTSNDHHKNNHHPMVYAIQTKSSMDSPYGHKQADSVAKPYDHLFTILTKNIVNQDENNDSANIDLKSMVVSHKDIANTFVTGTTEGYNYEMMTAVRSGNLDYIRTSYESQQHQQNKEKDENTSINTNTTTKNHFQCCNRFGESIIHTIARHGHYEMLQYLVEVVGVSMMVQCDTGRTPLHDACWTGCPNFDLIMYILRACPQFLFVKDSKGFTPLEYIPKDAHWTWIDFLNEQSNVLTDLILVKDAAEEE